MVNGGYITMVSYLFLVVLNLIYRELFFKRVMSKETVMEVPLVTDVQIVLT